MSSAHVAVVDDDPEITLLLKNYLQAQGYRVSQLHSGAALMALMRVDAPQLVLLDLNLPDEDGFAIARRLREHWHCGLVIVTGRGDAVDKVVGLEIGADDYVTKPFDLRELLARIKAVLRRVVVVDGPPATSTTTGNLAVPTTGGTRSRSRLCFEGWELDSGARQLFAPAGSEVALTTGEFELLTVFLQHPGRVLSRDFLLQATHRREAAPFDRTIDVQVGRLRRKLQDDADDPRVIKSVRGAGYLFVPVVELR